MHPADGRVVSNFIVQALRNEPITIYGDGSQTRSFCFVDDLVDGFLAMMASHDELVGPMNLGSPHEFTMLQLANLVISVTGSGSELVYQALPQDDPQQRQPNIAFANRELGWAPSIALEDGLEITVRYFRSVLSR